MLSKVLGRFVVMMLGIHMVPMRSVRVVSAFFMLAFGMMLGSHFVVLGGVLMMLGGVVMMICDRMTG